MAPKTLTVDAIDSLLREARVCDVQLDCIHQLLNGDPSPAENEEWRRKMKANTAMIFRDMVSYLYSVLDHIFYFLYCHFQNNGTESFSKDAFNIKQPISYNLKYSGPNPGARAMLLTRLLDCFRVCAREDLNHQERTFRESRNKWVEDRCKEIFGAEYYQNDKLDITLAEIRNLQKYLLSIQTIKEVDNAGKELRNANGGVKLLSACNIQQEPQEGPFNPTSIDFQELPSVKNIDNWNDAMTFNLLHFFRNFTTHRTLIECHPMHGYLKRDTMEFRSCENGENLDSEQWIKIIKGLWIEVPELSHLRQEKRDGPITFYKLPMLSVCDRLLSFVKQQRHNLLIIIGGQQAGDMDDPSFDWNEKNEPRIKINGQNKKWYNARFYT